MTPLRERYGVDMPGWRNELGPGPDRRRNGRLVLPVLAALLAGACAGTSTPAPSRTPAPTAAPTASPSPSPTADVAALFESKAAAMQGLNTTLAGQITFNEASGPIGGPIAGVYAASGGDEHTRLSVTVGTITEVQEEIVFAGTDYQRKGSEPWFEIGPAAPASSATSSGGLESILGTSLRDVGVEAKDGQQLHHLEPMSGAPIPPSAFGLGGIAGVTSVSLDFYAQDDGTPAVMSVGLVGTTPVNDEPTSFDVSVDFDFQPGPASITAPSLVWTRYEEPAAFYSVGYPEDWDADTKTETKEFLGPQSEALFVNGYKDPGDTLTKLTAATVSYDRKKLKATIDSSVAGKLDDQPARVITSHYLVDGQKVFGIDVVSIYKGFGYWITWGSPAGNEDIDSEEFQPILDSFTFTH